MRLIKKEIGIEEITSRIPGHFPYLEFDEFGLCEVHKASDSPMGCYGKIADAMKLDIGKNVYCGLYTFLPYEFINNDNGETIFDSYYHTLSEKAISDYDVYRYIDPEQTIYSFEWEKLSNDAKGNYTPSGYVLNTNSLGIASYSDYENNLTREERKKYEKFSYVSVSAIVYDGDETPDSGELMYYRKEGSIYDKNVIEWTNLTDEEKAEYNIRIYCDPTTEISVEARDELDEEIIDNYIPYKYILKKKLSIDKYDALSLNEQGQYTPYIYAALITAEEYNQKDETKCMTYNYRPYSFILKGGDEIIYLPEYRRLTERKKGDYELYSYIINNTDVISVEEYNKFLEDVGEGKTYIEIEGLGIDHYGVSLPQYTKCRLNNGEIYSYRTLMSCYYDLKRTDTYQGDGCAEFIVFIEDCIGRWPIQRAIDLFNTTYVEYSALSDTEMYPGDNNVAVESYNRILSDREGDNNCPIVYKNADNGKYLTIDEYKKLSEEERLNFEPYKTTAFFLGGDIPSDMDKEMMECYKLIRVYNEQLEEENFEYLPYEYYNTYDGTTIDVSEYENLDSIGQISYQAFYIDNNEENIISVAEYEELSSEDKENYHMIYCLDETGDDSISVVEYDALSYWGKNDYIVSNYYKVVNGSTDFIEDEIIDEVMYADLDEEDDNYACLYYRLSTAYVVVEEKIYDALNEYSKSKYEPQVYYNPTTAQYITQESYNDLSDEEKSNCSVYSYAYVDEVEGEIDLITSDVYDNLPYYGKDAYEEFLKKYYVIGEEGQDYPELNGNEIAFADEQYLVPNWLFIANASTMRDYLINLRIKIRPFIEGRTTNQRLCCLADEYRFRGGDDMIRLLTMLITVSEQVAEAYYNLSEFVINQTSSEKSVKNSYCLPVLLTANARDNGYITPYINYWEPGETLNIGEIFTYHNEFGDVTTYVVNGYVYEDTTAMLPPSDNDNENEETEDDTTDEPNVETDTTDTETTDTESDDNEEGIAEGENVDYAPSTSNTPKYKICYINDENELVTENYDFAIANLNPNNDVPNNIMVYHKDDETITLNLDGKCVKRYETTAFPDSNVTNRTVILNGSVDSRLKDTRRYVSYFNMYGDMERPSKNEDWLFYYRKGLIMPLISSTTDDGLPVTIHENFNLGLNNLLEESGFKYKKIASLTTTEGEVDNIEIYNIDAYGNIINDISYDKENHLITFEYTIGKHLILECIVPKENGRMKIQEMREGKYLIDDETVLSDNTGVDFTDVYEYYEGDELDNLIQNNQKCYKENTVGAVTKYEKYIKYDDYITLSDEERIPYVKCETEYTFSEVEGEPTEDSIYYPFIDKYVELIENGDNPTVTYVKTIEADEYNDLPKLTFDEYIVDMSDFDLSPKKFAFFRIGPLNYYTKRINYNMIDVEYMKSDFTTQHELNYDMLYSPTFKEDYLSAASYAPSVETNVDINRGNNTAFERHLRLSEIKTLNDMLTFRNGSFFNVQNNG